MTRTGYSFETAQKMPMSFDSLVRLVAPGISKPREFACRLDTTHLVRVVLIHGGVS